MKSIAGYETINGSSYQNQDNLLSNLNRKLVSSNFESTSELIKIKSL